MITRIGTGPLNVNTYIVSLSGSKVLVVDPACSVFSRDNDKVTSFLEKSGLVPAAVFLTHGHFDHVAGLKILKQVYPDIPVIIHKDDASCIGHEGNAFQTRSLMSMGFDDFIPYVTDLPEADLKVTDGYTLSEAGADEWTVIHTPGHTEGSACLYSKKQNCLISGDTVFYHSWGRTDLPGGNESQMQSSLNRIYSMLPENTLVYPGHDYSGFELGENL